MIHSFQNITPQILNELDNQYGYYREEGPLSAVTLQDTLELIFTLPIITGLGYIIPFLGVYSIFALILVVFASWRLGNTVSRMLHRYHQNH